MAPALDDIPFVLCAKRVDFERAQAAVARGRTADRATLAAALEHAATPSKPRTFVAGFNDQNAVIRILPDDLGRMEAIAKLDGWLPMTKGCTTGLYLVNDTTYWAITFFQPPTTLVDEVDGVVRWVAQSETWLTLALRRVLLDSAAHLTTCLLEVLGLLSEAEATAPSTLPYYRKLDYTSLVCNSARLFADSDLRDGTDAHPVLCGDPVNDMYVTPSHSDPVRHVHLDPSDDVKANSAFPPANAVPVRTASDEQDEVLWTVRDADAAVRLRAQSLPDEPLSHAVPQIVWVGV